MIGRPNGAETSPQNGLTMALKTSAFKLREMLDGYLASRLIYLAVKLQIAEALRTGASSAEELAAVTKVAPATLRRVLAGLVMCGVLAQDKAGRFSLSRLGEGLLDPTLCDWAIVTGELLYPAADELARALSADEAVFERRFGEGFFPHLWHDEALSGCFYRGLERATRAAARALATSPLLDGAQVVVDVGGGHGATMSELLALRSELRGVVFDQAKALRGARKVLERAGVLERASLRRGDFFQKVPDGGDVYLLSWVLHDWNDADAMRLLSRCRAAMEAGARLIVVEALLPARAVKGSSAVRLDLVMMLLTGGRERAPQEYEALFRKTGLALNGIHPLAAGRSALVATPS